GQMRRSRGTPPAPTPAEPPAEAAASEFSPWESYLNRWRDESAIVDTVAGAVEAGAAEMARGADWARDNSQILRTLDAAGRQRERIMNPPQPATPAAPAGENPAAQFTGGDRDSMGRVPSDPNYQMPGTPQQAVEAVQEGRPMTPSLYDEALTRNMRYATVEAMQQDLPTLPEEEVSRLAYFLGMNTEGTIADKMQVTQAVLAMGGHRMPGTPQRRPGVSIDRVNELTKQELDLRKTAQEIEGAEFDAAMRFRATTAEEAGGRGRSPSLQAVDTAIEQTMLDEDDRKFPNTDPTPLVRHYISRHMDDIQLNPALQQELPMLAERALGTTLQEMGDTGFLDWFFGQDRPEGTLARLMDGVTVHDGKVEIRIPGRAGKRAYSERLTLQQLIEHNGEPLGRYILQRAQENAARGTQPAG
ncbi:MAG: hypothetical protein OXE50_16365, partial [Chloroflexi bacterium]|nr:hypothetical protein [Chloroflexota bacterium]